MKKTISILTLYVTLYSLLIVQEACTTSCGDDSGPMNHSLDYITVEVKKIIPDQTEYLSTQSHTASAEGIRYDELALSVSHTWKVIAYNAKGQLFNQAFACDPAHKFDLVDDVTITSTEDYSAQYPKGTDLKEIISVYSPSQGLYYKEGEKFSDFVERTKLNNDSFQSNYPTAYLLTFNTPPSESKTHTFTITYKLKSGVEVQKVIPDLKINN